MRRASIPLAFLLLAILVLGTAAPALSVSCSPTGYKGLTAALINPGSLSGVEVDATGCGIGVYYNKPGRFTIQDSVVHGASWYGVVNDGTTVNILDSEVYDIGDDPFSGAQHGVAIYFDYTHGGSGRIVGNEIYLYQKGGIAINGAKSSATVTGNTITGLDSVNFIAQNGIQFGYGATGTAMRNTVDGNWYTGAGWASTGILLFETDNVIVQGNDILNNQTGIGIETWGWYRASASNNKVIGNTILGSAYGAQVYSHAWPDVLPPGTRYTNMDPVASNNKITNNTITSELGYVGVAVFLWDESTSFTATARNNKLINNAITGFAYPLYDEGTASKVHANAIEP